VRRGRSICQQIRGVALDQAISALLIELMTPMTVDIALAVQQEIEVRIGETDELRRTQLERARYEAELARRRYMKADPDNRLVVNNLEADWNDKLRQHLAAQEDYEQQTEKERRLIDTHTRQQSLSLVEKFPRVWNDPNVEARERKRIVRLLIEDVTLVRPTSLLRKCDFAAASRALSQYSLGYRPGCCVKLLRPSSLRSMSFSTCTPKLRSRRF
jgi:hypothetical protein